MIRVPDRVTGIEQMAIELLRGLGRWCVRLKSLTAPFVDVDTSSTTGEAIVGIMAVIAHCESP